MTISIIIPTFNEALNIVSCLQRTQAAHPHAEIIVVDGGSDETEKLVKNFSIDFPQVRYISNRPDLGKGHAIRVGIEAAKGDIIVQMDADLQFYPEEISLLIAPLEQNVADFVCGSRFAPQSNRSEGGTPLLRSFGNVFISFCSSCLFGVKMTDVLAGFKAWKKEVTKSFELESNSYSYELELPVKAIFHGFRVVDVAISTVPRVKGESSVRIFRVGFKILFDMILWKWRCRAKIT